MAAGCLVVLMVAAIVARALTRWVLRPLDGLERAVAEMTEGVAGPPCGRGRAAGVAPLHLGLQHDGAGGAGLSRASTTLVADASHQLRNPLAAVRLRADSLADSVTESGQPTYQSMTGELDRLENLLGQLMRLARAEQVSGSRQVGLSATAGESTNLGDVIAERIAFWQPVADGQGCSNCVDRSNHSDLSVQVARHDVEQLLDVAVDNALRYAGRAATVTVSTAANRRDAPN